MRFVSPTYLIIDLLTCILKLNFFLKRVADLVQLLGLSPVVESASDEDFTGFGMGPDQAQDQQMSAGTCPGKLRLDRERRRLFGDHGWSSLPSEQIAAHFG